jgi:hypothetical protein
MPGTLMERDELDDPPVPAYQKMGRDLEADEFLVIRVGFVIERITEELFNGRAAKLSRRQADGMDHNDLYDRAGWPGIEIG